MNKNYKGGFTFIKSIKALKGIISDEEYNKLELKTKYNKLKKIIIRHNICDVYMISCDGQIAMYDFMRLKKNILSLGTLDNNILNFDINNLNIVKVRGCCLYLKIGGEM